jgi:hypothetical protein
MTSRSTTSVSPLFLVPLAGSSKQSLLFAAVSLPIVPVGD